MYRSTLVTYLLTYSWQGLQCSRSDLDPRSTAVCFIVDLTESCLCCCDPTPITSCLALWAITCSVTDTLKSNRQLPIATNNTVSGIWATAARFAENASTCQPSRFPPGLWVRTRQLLRSVGSSPSVDLTKLSTWKASNGMKIIISEDFPA